MKSFHSNTSDWLTKLKSMFVGVHPRGDNNSTPRGDSNSTQGVIATAPLVRLVHSHCESGQLYNNYIIILHTNISETC